MPGSVIGAVAGGVVNGIFGGKAASAQTKGNDQAIALQRDQYIQNRSDIFPTTAQGYSAQNVLGQLLGLGTLGSNIRGAGQYTTNVPQVGANSTTAPAVGNSRSSHTALGGPEGSVENQIAQLEAMLGTGQLAQNPFGQQAALIRSQIDVLRGQKGQTAATSTTPAASTAPDTSTINPLNIQDYLKNLPGYQFQLDQGSDAIQRSAAARGLLGSGQTLKALSDYGQNTASNYFQNYMNQLSGVAGYGINSQNQLANLGQNYANQVGQLYQDNGATRASAYQAQGQNIGNALGNLPVGWSSMPNNAGYGGQYGNIIWN